MSAPHTTVVTVLGAGAMGSALATPLRERGQSVRLWGTWLDDHLLDAIEANQPHPRTNVFVPSGTELFRSAEIEAALTGADVVILSVASVGVEEVVRRAAQWIAEIGTLVVTSKGFVFGADGRVLLLPECITAIFTELGLTPPTIIAVGGPCKANEVAAGRPTATIYGSVDIEAVRAVVREIETDDYRIEITPDVHGLEVAAPFKNIYAIALGFADGLAELTPEPWHNLKSAIFSQALREMADVAVQVGGNVETVYGLAGSGDLEVTGLSGRNKVYGARVGAGQSAEAALAAMVELEQTVEGIPAVKFAVALTAQLYADGPTRLPLLHAIEKITAGSLTGLEDLKLAVLPAAVGYPVLEHVES
jgi:glycerol-3-phosphate dehydrogenase (NAD(P)+)